MAIREAAEGLSFLSQASARQRCRRGRLQDRDRLALQTIQRCAFRLIRVLESLMDDGF
jgi:hypothetical protein